MPLTITNKGKKREKYMKSFITPDKAVFLQWINHCMISSHLFYGSVNFQTDQLIFRLISKILRPLACVTNSSQVWPDMVMIHILFDRGDYYACSDEPDLTAEAYFFSQWQSFTEVDFWSNSTIWKSKFLEFPIRWKKNRIINAPENVSGNESS